MVDDLFTVSRCGIPSVILNSKINTLIELNNLKFHTINKKGESKCHWMHVGHKEKNTKCCNNPKVHGENMLEVNEDIYLGKVIRKDGKDSSNIRARVAKGIVSISQIMNILDSVTFGRFKVEIGLLLRQSVYLSQVFSCPP